MRRKTYNELVIDKVEKQLEKQSVVKLKNYEYEGNGDDIIAYFIYEEYEVVKNDGIQIIGDAEFYMNLT